MSCGRDDDRPGMGTQRRGRCPLGVWSASFVLGALMAEERELFVEHMSDCSSCDQAVNELLPVVRVLDTIFW